MNEENNTNGDKKTFLNKINWLILLIFFIALVGISYYAVKFYFSKNPLPENNEQYAHFGDYFGGILGPIFSLFGLFALLYTIRLQSKALKVSTEELQLSRKELEQTREELKKAADAQTKSSKVMEEQLKTQSFQQFDSVFFNLLKEMKQNIPDKELIETYYNDYLYGKFSFYKKDADIYLQEVISDLVLDENFSIFFIFLYQLIKIIDTNIHMESEEEKKKSQKKYSNIIRASFSQKIIRLLLINISYTGFDTTNYKKLLEEFSFFEHLSFKDFNKYNPLLIYLASQLEPIALGNNQSWAKINNEEGFSEIFPIIKGCNLKHFHHMLNEALKKT